MRAEEQFDSFYLKSRRALVHQTFALTGDIAAAQRAVRDAYVGAWHHWRKVKHYQDPRDWVRPRAWAQAQRRHSARLWQRTRDLSVEDRAVLDALHKLPAAERRALVMLELAGVPPEVAARELNVTQETLRRQHESATAGFASALHADPSTVRAHLMTLGEATSKPALPRSASIRREGGSRRRNHTLAAAAAATFLAVGTGAFAYEPAGQVTGAGSSITSPDVTEPTESVDPEEESTLPTAEDLLGPKDVDRLDPKAPWRIDATHDNTAGEGINYVCQQERFADPEGLATIVRVLKAGEGRGVRSVVQSVEISKDADAAASTYSTVLSWFTGCNDGQVHLKRSFDVAGVGDHAALLELESWSQPRNTYSVAVGQVGQVVTTSVVRTLDSSPPKATNVARTLATAAESICERAGEKECSARPRLKQTPPAPSGEAPGFLATVDMPPLTGVGKPWVGTDPEPVKNNLAATSCDHTDFRKDGAVTDRTRTFLVTGARLPDTFGLTETYGRFKSAKDAAKFMRTIQKRFATCEDRDLATEVVAEQSLHEGSLKGATWRLNTELSQSRVVVFDVGFVRRGATVAQVTFVPAGSADFPFTTFRALVTRAGQRLGELD